jgi:hypothetical protein
MCVFIHMYVCIHSSNMCVFIVYTRALYRDTCVHSQLSCVCIHTLCMCVFNVSVYSVCVFIVYVCAFIETYVSHIVGLLCLYTRSLLIHTLCMCIHRDLCASLKTGNEKEV